jgi:hypothetical protein
MLPEPSRVLQSLVATDVDEDGMFMDVLIPEIIVLKAMLAERYLSSERDRVPFCD